MITTETVKHIAKLARLHLSEAEEKLYAEQLGKIIEYFDELAVIDTSGVEAMSHAVNEVNLMRDDKLVTAAGHEAFLLGAPDSEGSFFRVPRISE